MDNVKSGDQLNRKVSGKPSNQDSKYTRKQEDRTMAKKARKDQVIADSKSTRSSKEAKAQTRGQNERDPKKRNGQYGAAGDAPLMKK